MSRIRRCILTGWGAGVLSMPCGPTMDGTGKRTLITTVAFSAYHEGEALALVIEDIRELIDSRLT